MNILKELLKKKDGSLTVEAAISLPLFMCVFLSIAFFMKVVYIHNNVQYAINGAANEVATYSYLYSISGLQKVNDAIRKQRMNMERLHQSIQKRFWKLLMPWEIFHSRVWNRLKDWRQVIQHNRQVKGVV